MARAAAGRLRVIGIRGRLGLALLLVLPVGLFAWWRMLPQPLFATPQSYVLEARDGTLLGARIASDGQWRFPAKSLCWLS